MAITITGVSKRIDGCSGLLVQKANQMYYSVPEAHKRWIDRDDVLQESLIAAWQCTGYKAGAGRKFSTYLYQRLEWQAKHLHTSLGFQMRDGAVAELDAPLKQAETKTIEIPTSPDQGRDEDDVRSFISLCRAVKDQTVVALVYGFLCGNSRKATPEICAEIAGAAAKLSLDPDSLLRVGGNEKSRKTALTMLSKDLILGSDTEAGLRILECVECEGTFTIAAIREGRFHVETMTCRTCYKKLKALPAGLSCFGKGEKYSEADASCRIHCKDRKVCKVMKDEEVDEVEDTEEEEDELEDVDLEEVAEKKGKAKAKPAKEGKPKKAKKEKEEDDPVPAGIGPRWPYKKGSQRRWAFQVMLDGIKKAAFEKQCKSNVDEKGKPCALNIKALLKSMRGGPGVKRATHNWKMNEEGDTFKIYAVTYHGKAKAEKPKVAKPAKAAEKPKAATKKPEAKAKGKGKK